MDSGGHGTTSRSAWVALGRFRNAGELGTRRPSRLHSHRARIDIVLHRGRFRAFSKSALAKSAFGLAEHSAVGNLGLVALKGQPNPAGIFKVA